MGAGRSHGTAPPGTAAVGLVVNLVMKLLAAGSAESLNVKGAHFEMPSDMLGSLDVIAAAIVVMFTGLRAGRWPIRSSAPASDYSSFRAPGSC